MAEQDEPVERMRYRLGCKYCTAYQTCMKNSGYLAAGIHVTIGCTPDSKCRRMRNFDKKTLL